jgi:predicted phage-related endonuclease
MELNSTSINWINEYRSTQEKIAELETYLKEVLRKNIEEALGDETAGELNGVPVITWKYVDSTRFDQTKAKAILAPGDLAKCMTTQTSRVLRLAKIEA